MRADFEDQHKMFQLAAVSKKYHICVSNLCMDVF